MLQWRYGAGYVIEIRSWGRNRGEVPAFGSTHNIWLWCRAVLRSADVFGSIGSRDEIVSRRSKGDYILAHNPKTRWRLCKDSEKVIKLIAKRAAFRPDTAGRELRMFRRWTISGSNGSYCQAGDVFCFPTMLVFLIKKRVKSSRLLTVRSMKEEAGKNLSLQTRHSTVCGTAVPVKAHWLFPQHCHLLQHRTCTRNHSSVTSHHSTAPCRLAPLSQSSFANIEAAISIFTALRRLRFSAPLDAFQITMLTLCAVAAQSSAGGGRSTCPADAD